MEQNSFPLWYTMVWCWWFGALNASFLCVVAERVPRGLSLGGRSKCVCGRQLKLSENIPIFGWLRARGKATCCGATLPRFYLWAELYLSTAWLLAPLFDPWYNIAWGTFNATLLVAAGIPALRDRTEH
jgi:prepilin signal peptidase PulO-like enzyme (type II secretory pathway)